MHPRMLAAVGAAGVLALASTAFAVRTRLWEVTNEAEFSRGELENAVVTSAGSVHLGRKLTEIKSEEKGFWSSAVGQDGTLYLGGGDNGKVFRLDGDKLAEVGDTGEMMVTALAVDGAGVLFAATLPNGRIFRLGKEGKLELFATLPAPNVWCLAPGTDGALYAGAGPKGRLYRVAAGAGSEELYVTRSENILSLVAGEKGDLYFGTAKPGVVYRRTSEGKVRGLADLGTHEIRAMAWGPGGLTVAANLPGEAVGAAASEGTGKAGGAIHITPSGGAPTITIDEDELGGGDGEGKAAVAPDAKGGEGALYRVDARGALDELVRLPGGLISSVVASADGAVYAASSSAGKVFQFLADNVNSTLLNAQGRQALTLALEKGALRYVGMSHPAGVFRVESERAESGSLVSEVFDARFSADWGRIHWVGNGALGFATRSGNSATPDETWSDWSPIVEGNPVAVSAPPGRFLQWKAAWTQDRQATLTAVRVAYLVQNQRPRVTSVSLSVPEGGDEGEGKPATPSAATALLGATLSGSEAGKDKGTSIGAHDGGGSGTGGLHKLGQQVGVVKKLTWAAEDPDGDALGYRLWFAEQGTTRWIPLTHGDPMLETTFDWNTESVPDGYYVVKVEATDENANPREAVLKSSKVSSPILVDNTRPVVRGLAVGDDLQLTGTAEDSASLIDELEYSVDGGAWHPAWPEGRLADRRQAAFRIRLEGLAVGDHVVAVRAKDLAGNVGAAQVPFGSK
ncbi:MAG: hypothetical protein HYZ53_06680 [Planctomycetes bacterium]|nr:hypothetical protein [Planctomycetota bacterium]